MVVKKKKTPKKLKKINPKNVKIPEGTVSFHDLMRNILKVDPTKK